MWVWVGVGVGSWFGAEFSNTENKAQEKAAFDRIVGNNIDELC